MELCTQCAALPERADKLPTDTALAHLGPERRIGDSSPHFPKKYVRECPACGCKWGIVHVSTWDSKWVRINDQQP